MTLNDITIALTAITTIAVVVERTTQLIKPIYMKIKNKIMIKQVEELSAMEKETISIVVGILLCLLSNTGVPLSNQTEYINCIIAGLISSLGSNVLHSIIAMLTITKTNMEIKE